LGGLWLTRTGPGRFVLTVYFGSVRYWLAAPPPGRDDLTHAAAVHSSPATLARACLRLTGIALVTGGYFVIWQCGRLLTWISPDLRRGWRRLISRRWAAAVGRVVGMRLAVHGTPPRAPFLLVANHLSYMDVLVLLSQLGCAFVAKREIAKWPVLGYLTRQMDAVFVERGDPRDLQAAIVEMEHRLQMGLGVVVFPEGTTSSGKSVAPFRSSMLDVACRTRRPVHYATISYRSPDPARPAHESICWWGEVSMSEHFFRLLQLSYFQAEVRFGPAPLEAGDRKALASALWAAVSAAFTPVPQKSTSLTGSCREGALRAAATATRSAPSADGSPPLGWSARSTWSRWRVCDARPGRYPNTTARQSRGPPWQRRGRR
jgi:1-acyl-sn-glycerol-3-phosphate acyltransferase